MSYNKNSRIELTEAIHSTREIRQFIKENGIFKFMPKFTILGGVGDSAGSPPTSTVEEFFRLYLKQQRIPTQKEYAFHCFDAWSAWYSMLTDVQQQGVMAKLYCNFYPSFIDSIYAHALIQEMGFDVVIDTFLDCVRGVDILIKAYPKKLCIALTNGSESARKAVGVKYGQGRGHSKKAGLIFVHKNGDWYTTRDFEFLYKHKPSFNCGMFNAFQVATCM